MADADWIIDLGPKAARAAEGSWAQGMPEQVAGREQSIPGSISGVSG